MTISKPSNVGVEGNYMRLDRDTSPVEIIFRHLPKYTKIGGKATRPGELQIDHIWNITTQSAGLRRISHGIPIWHDLLIEGMDSLKTITKLGCQRMSTPATCSSTTTSSIQELSLDVVVRGIARHEKMVGRVEDMVVKESIWRTSEVFLPLDHICQGDIDYNFIPVPKAECGDEGTLSRTISKALSNGFAPEAQRDSVCNNLITFDPDGDPDNPVEWPNSYRWGVILLLAFMAFTVTFTCVGVVPVAGQIILDLEGRESKSASVLLVTIWELGEAAGPLTIAPLSEVYGRYPIFNCANVLFILWTVVAASSPTSGLFIFSRFLTGCAVASNVLNPAIIGDMFPPQQRGSGMAVLMLAPLLGGAVGPAIAGAIAELIGWRPILYFAALLATVCELAFLFLFRETYELRILRQRAARKLKENCDPSLKAAFDAEHENSLTAIWQSIKRPAAVFFGSFVLQILSLYGALAFAFFYILTTTLPDMLHDIYGFSPAATGSAFLSFSVGSVIAIVICTTVLDRVYVKLQEANNGIALPEHRMPLLIVGALLLPVCIALFGWSAQQQWPVTILLLSVALLGFSLILGIVPLMSYVVDAFGNYSASALTAVLITRCLMGTFLPLAVAPLTDALGYGLGFSVLVAACLVVAPIPMVAMRYGSRWRQRSVYTRDT
ncbi:hypothetical protein B7494_g7443 [Chlorociboria aeruginascens]|nr:hypothetical protein B7494_g7443 [Chlorociboria aeruginascens]